MKEKVVYRMMHENCKKYCDSKCPVKERCCVKTSCTLVWKNECSEETKKLYDRRRRLPFLRADGCIVPPHERKFCATFICDLFAKSKQFKRHMQLMNMLPIRDKMNFKGRLNRLIAWMAEHDDFDHLPFKPYQEKRR